MIRPTCGVLLAIALAGCGGTDAAPFDSAGGSGSSGASSGSGSGGSGGSGSGGSSGSSSGGAGSSSGGSGGSSGTGTKRDGGALRDAGEPADAPAGPEDAPPPPPYDGPPGQFVYGPPSGTSGLPGLLSSLQIVTVTWGSDTESIVSDIATAFGALQGSSWWAAVSGYCVPGTSSCVGQPVTVTATHVGDPPGMPISDSAIAQSAMSRFPKFINDKAMPDAEGKTDLPTPVTASTLYVFFMPLALAATSKAPALPQGYAVTVDGAPSCGYHSATTVGGTSVAYVVVPRCQVAGQSDADVAIARAFREIADAVTDPFRALGRLGFNDPSNKSAFEIGDFCSSMTGTARGIGGFSVPQVWSDAATACVP